jgi:hypothetical protein
MRLEYAIAVPASDPPLKIDALLLLLSSLQDRTNEGTEAGEQHPGERIRK